MGRPRVGPTALRGSRSVQARSFEEVLGRVDGGWRLVLQDKPGQNGGVGLTVEGSESKNSHSERTMPAPPTSPGPNRRGMLATFLMFVGVVIGYGTGAWHFFEYLVPLRSHPKRREMFIGTLVGFPIGSSRTLSDPKGQGIVLTRLNDGGGDASGGFQALSTKCPHLGCSIHWENAKQRFRCPCHEGIFDREGRAISGPPAAENKNMGTYEVRVDAANGWVFLMVPEETRYGV